MNHDTDEIELDALRRHCQELEKERDLVKAERDALVVQLQSMRDLVRGYQGLLDIAEELMDIRKERESLEKKYGLAQSERGYPDGRET
jgi:hypothetical protein